MSITDSGYNEPVKRNCSETTLDYSVNSGVYLEKVEDEKSESISCAEDVHPHMVEKRIWQIQSTVGSQPIAVSFMENKEIEVWTRIVPAPGTNPLSTSNKNIVQNIQKNIDNKTYLVLPKKSDTHRQYEPSETDDMFPNRFDSTMDVKYSDWDVIDNLRTRTRTNLNDSGKECHSAKSSTSVEKYKSRESICPNVKESKSEVTKNDFRKELNSKNAELDQKFNNSMEKLMKFMKSRKGNGLGGQPKPDVFTTQTELKANLTSDAKISKGANIKRPGSASSNNRKSNAKAENRPSPLGLRDYEPVFTKTGLMSTVKKSITKKLDEPRMNFSNNAKKTYLYTNSRR